MATTTITPALTEIAPGISTDYDFAAEFAEAAREDEARETYNSIEWPYWNEIEGKWEL